MGTAFTAFTAFTALRRFVAGRLVLVPGRHHPISIEATGARVTVSLAGRVVADTRDALTLREAGHPPVQYLPLRDVDAAVLEPSDHSTHCPYKGDATYYDLKVTDNVAPAAAWTYLAPHRAVAAIRSHVAFVPGRVDAIEVHDPG